eukprot:COSAG06_NODE_327_length_17446_cov_7.157491_1_plen_1923_part_10
MSPLNLQGRKLIARSRRWGVEWVRRFHRSKEEEEEEKEEEEEEEEEQTGVVRMILTAEALEARSRSESIRCSGLATRVAVLTSICSFLAPPASAQGPPADSSGHIVIDGRPFKVQGYTGRYSGDGTIFPAIEDPLLNVGERNPPSQCDRASDDPLLVSTCPCGSASMAPGQNPGVSLSGILNLNNCCGATGASTRYNCDVTCTGNLAAGISSAPDHVCTAGTLKANSDQISGWSDTSCCDVMCAGNSQGPDFVCPDAFALKPDATQIAGYDAELCCDAPVWCSDSPELSSCVCPAGTIKAMAPDGGALSPAVCSSCPTATWSLSSNETGSACCDVMAGRIRRTGTETSWTCAVCPPGKIQSYPAATSCATPTPQFDSEFECCNTGHSVAYCDAVPSVEQCQDCPADTYPDYDTSGSKFPGSSILSEQDETLLRSWLPPAATGATWTLCYRKSTDGASSATFHTLCDSFSQTVLMMTMSTGKTIGGFAAVSWDAGACQSGVCHDDAPENGHVEQGEAVQDNFLFSLTLGVKSTPLNCDITHHSGAHDNADGCIYQRNIPRGPTWGAGRANYGHDLEFQYDMCDSASGLCQCALGGTYSCPDGTEFGAACWQAWCGVSIAQNGWSATEVEVYGLLPAACTPCPDGSTAPIGSAQCVCPVDTYWDTSGAGAAACTACPSGSTASAGSTECVCSAGTYWDTSGGGSAACTACPSGTTTASAGATSSVECVCQVNAYTAFTSRDEPADICQLVDSPAGQWIMFQVDQQRCLADPAAAGVEYSAIDLLDSNGNCNTWASWVQMAEVVFFGLDGQQVHAASVTASEGDSGTWGNLIDGDTGTKFCPPARLNTMVGGLRILFELPPGSDVRTFTWTTANDERTRDPVQWRLWAITSATPLETTSWDESAALAQFPGWQLLTDEWHDQTYPTTLERHTLVGPFNLYENAPCIGWACVSCPDGATAAIGSAECVCPGETLWWSGYCVSRDAHALLRFKASCARMGLADITIAADRYTMGNDISYIDGVTLKQALETYASGNAPAGTRTFGWQSSASSTTGTFDPDQDTSVGRVYWKSIAYYDATVQTGSGSYDRMYTGGEGVAADIDGSGSSTGASFETYSFSQTFFCGYLDGWAADTDPCASMTIVAVSSGKDYEVDIVATAAQTYIDRTMYFMDESTISAEMLGALFVRSSLDDRMVSVDTDFLTLSFSGGGTVYVAIENHVGWLDTLGFQSTELEFWDGASSHVGSFTVYSLLLADAQTLTFGGNAGTSITSPGFTVMFTGWTAVGCTDGAVTSLNIDSGSLMGDVEELAALSSLSTLIIQHADLTGNIGTLASLSNLASMDASLTEVYGYMGEFTFEASYSSCASFSCSEPGESLIPDAANYAGRDRCACCAPIEGWSVRPTGVLPSGECGAVGCTDSLATNYDATATVDDGGCAYDCVSLLAGVAATQRIVFSEVPTCQLVANDDRCTEDAVNAGQTLADAGAACAVELSGPVVIQGKPLVGFTYDERHSGLISDANLVTMQRSYRSPSWTQIYNGAGRPLVMRFLRFDPLPIRHGHAGGSAHQAWVHVYSAGGLLVLEHCAFINEAAAVSIVLKSDSYMQEGNVAASARRAAMLLSAKALHRIHGCHFAGIGHQMILASTGATIEITSTTFAHGSQAANSATYFEMTFGSHITLSSCAFESLGAPITDIGSALGPIVSTASGTRAPYYNTMAAFSLHLGVGTNASTTAAGSLQIETCDSNRVDWNQTQGICGGGACSYAQPGVRCECADTSYRCSVDPNVCAGGFMAANMVAWRAALSGVCTPCEATQAPSTDTTSMGVSGGTYQWSFPVLGPDGKIYMPPANADAVAIIDPVQGTIDVQTMSALGSGNKWNGGVVAPDGKIYSLPSDSDAVLIVDPAAQTVDSTTITGLSTASGKWNGGVLGPDGS